MTPDIVRFLLDNRDTIEKIKIIDDIDFGLILRAAEILPTPGFIVKIYNDKNSIEYGEKEILQFKLEDTKDVVNSNQYYHFKFN
jgi:hypothetical protein